MKLIGVTQRMEFIKDYKENRDALDENWSKFLLKCNLIPIILPNDLNCTKNIIKYVNLQGFLFTGGNSLEKYGGQAKERDVIEGFCMKYAIENNLPILGVCRGMQFIQDYFGIELKEIPNHVAVKHKINSIGGTIKVNSYHNFGTTDTISEILTTAYSEDTIVEAIMHKVYNIHGIMWHPERENPFKKEDIYFFKKVFKGEDY